MTDTRTAKSAPRLLADCHLGKVARYLRLFGFDTLFYESIDDNDILKIATDEERIVLTRDRELCVRLKERCCYLRSQRFEEQLSAVFETLSLRERVRPFTRCMRCNGLLVPVAKADILHRLESKTIEYFDSFAQCASCGQVYWEGDHHGRLDSFVSRFLAGKEAPEKPDA